MKQQDSFMQQFSDARKEVTQLRSWMGESAKMATLTFPATVPPLKAPRRVVAPTKPKR
ncbi:hypothetical protein [uncultured Aquincola sp.]|uniref:hypothetical protein n=1 Tax=uncultured Aquincola sp. TaxID=886556 RepID=UPI0032B1F750|tara:strand:- start:106 stop:279 length:174 start_codon:yes stop_codon:yes gene_type:complete